VRLDGPEATIAVGGHPLPLLVKDGEVQAIGQHGSLLGALRNVRWPQSTCTLRPGETLLAFTDGVTDALGADGERFGSERLTNRLGHADGLSVTAVCRTITDALASFQHGEQADDIAILALRFRGPKASGAPTEDTSPMLAITTT
jgi:serine phosphatase RsbU (regulator of sigma subunit)